MTTKVGSRVGSIRLTSVLSRGGMGEVYEGYDETLQRSVAVKAIRGENALSGASRTRFLYEARTLSSLAHPNLCLVHDYVESDGEAYLVMELIEGCTLTQAIDQDLSWRQKLDFALQVADVLTVAHARGIVHRDLKPDNLMLTTSGVAKVLDFGIARSEGSRPEPEQRDARGDGARKAPSIEPIDTFTMTESLGIDSRHTRPGAIVGTPSYMSPEQARGEEVSPASDMYSFGLVLQQLFTGAPPHEPGLSKVELVKQASRGESLPLEGLTTELASLIQQLKSLSLKDRPTADRTLESLRRLRGRPARRRRTAAILILVLVAVLAGIKYTVDLRDERELALAARDEAEAARDEAQAARNQAEAVNDFLVDLLASAGPDEAQSRDVTVRELLDRTAADLPKREDVEPNAKVRFLVLTGHVYTNLGYMKESRQVLESAVELAEQVPDLEGRLHAQSLLSLGRIEEMQGDLALARGHYERAEEIVTNKMPEDTQARATVLMSIANVQSAEGNLEGAEAFSAEALELIRELKGPDHPQTAMLMGNLANLAEDQGDCERSIELNREVLRIFEASFGPEHTHVATVLNNVGACYETVGRLDEARDAHARSLAIREKVLGPESADTAQSMLNLAAVQIKLGQLDEAQSLVERGTEATMAVYGPAHPQVVGAQLIAVELAEARGDLDAAELHAREAVATAGSLEGHFSEAVAAPGYLIDVLLQQDKPREALQVAETTLEHLRSSLGPDHYWVANIWVYVAEVRLALGEPEAARRALEAARSAGYVLEEIEAPTELARLARDMAAESAAIGE